MRSSRGPCSTGTVSQLTPLLIFTRLRFWKFCASYWTSSRDEHVAGGELVEVAEPRQVGGLVGGDDHLLPPMPATTNGATAPCGATAPPRSARGSSRHRGRRRRRGRLGHQALLGSRGAEPGTAAISARTTRTCARRAPSSWRRSRVTGAASSSGPRALHSASRGPSCSAAPGAGRCRDRRAPPRRAR